VIALEDVGFKPRSAPAMSTLSASAVTAPHNLSDAGMTVAEPTPAPAANAATLQELLDGNKRFVEVTICTFGGPNVPQG